MKNFAVIFDMDGVVVDNTKYHILAWQKFAKQHGTVIPWNNFVGRLNKELLPEVLKRKIPTAEIKKLAEAKEALYRKMYKNHIRPLKGLPVFLKSLKKGGIKIALATAAPKSNVSWVLNKTGLKKYFKIIIDETNVRKGKPDPEVFLKAAKKLKFKAKNCIVFEDGMRGIAAGRRAGMKVIGVATTHRPAELKHTDLVIKNFSKIRLAELSELFEK